MKTKSYIKALLVASLFLFGGCLEKIPEDVMDEATMVEFMTDAYRIEGFFAAETGFRSEAMGPEVLRAYTDLFDKYGITDSTFEKSIDFYMRDGVRFEQIHKQVLANLKADAEE